MRKQLWFRSRLCTSCSDCETACVFTHTMDWQPEEVFAATAEDGKKVSLLLGRKATEEEAQRFATIRTLLENKKQTPIPSLLTLFPDSGYIISCRHCENAKCAKACHTGAITRTKESIVIANSDHCIGCKICAQACAIGAPSYLPNGKMVKCDLCKERLAEGQEPACVAICAEKALLLKDLREVYAPKPQGNEQVGLGLRELWHNEKKEPEYMLRFRGNGGGYWTADQLDVIAKWSDQLVDCAEYEAGYLDITLRQDIELHHLRFQDEAQKQEFFTDLERHQIYLGTFGPLFRSIVSCIGGSCQKARGDAKKLGHDLYLKLNEAGFNLPKLKGKIKVGISGCLEGCGHMRMYDITIAMAAADEVEGEKVVGEKGAGKILRRLFLGGNMGRFPQAGVQIAALETDEEVIDFILKAAEFFKDRCELGNIHRLSYWIRVKYGQTGDPFIFSVEGISKFLADFAVWVEKKYGKLGWLAKLQVEADIPEAVLAFRDYHQKTLQPMDIYDREDVFPHLIVKEED